MKSIELLSNVLEGVGQVTFSESEKFIYNQISNLRTDLAKDNVPTESLENIWQGNSKTFSDLDVKKVLLRSIIQGKAKGNLPFEIPTNPMELASLVDHAYAVCKTSYLVGVEKMYPEQAVNEVIDRMAARAKVSIDAYIDKKIEKIPDIVVSICPQVLSKHKETISKIVNTFSPKVKTYIHKGVETVAAVAKVTAKTVFTAAASKVTSFVGRFFK